MSDPLKEVVVTVPKSSFKSSRREEASIEKKVEEFENVSSSIRNGTNKIKGCGKALEGAHSLFEIGGSEEAVRKMFDEVTEKAADEVEKIKGKIHTLTALHNDCAKCAPLTYRELELENKIKKTLDEFQAAYKTYFNFQYKLSKRLRQAPSPPSSRQGSVRSGSPVEPDPTSGENGLRSADPYPALMPPISGQGLPKNVSLVDSPCSAQVNPSVPSGECPEEAKAATKKFHQKIVDGISKLTPSKKNKNKKNKKKKSKWPEECKRKLQVQLQLGIDKERELLLRNEIDTLEADMPFLQEQLDEATKIEGMCEEALKSVTGTARSVDEQADALQKIQSKFGSAGEKQKRGSKDLDYCDKNKDRKRRIVVTIAVLAVTAIGIGLCFYFAPQLFTFAAGFASKLFW